MSNDFWPHIKLGRAFRPHVLATMKDVAGWTDYLAANGFTGRSESMTNKEIKTACYALGLDLDTIYAAFFSTIPLPAGKSTIDMERENENTDEDDNMTNLEIDAQVEARLAKASEDEGAENMFEGANVDDVIADVLAPASVHMTPHLASMMPALLRPLVEAAAKGPRIVVQTVTQLVDESGTAVAPVAPVAPCVNVLRKTPLYAAFGMRKSDASAPFRHAFENIAVNVCDYVGAPAIDYDYIWQADVLAQLGAMDVCALNAWTYGPAGIGKTDGARQYAARLGRPFVRIPIERTTEPAELIGQEVPQKGGGFKWSDGKLTRAFRVPNCVILIDEPSLLRSGTLAVIMTALDTRELHLVTGEVVRAAEGVFIIAGDNTSGCGDDTGRYVDTAPLSAAFMDRWALKIQYHHLPVGQETTMLSTRAGIHPVAAKIMVEYAALTRQDADKGKLTMGITPRRLLAWAHVVRVGVSSAKAWHASVVTSASPEDREALIMLEGVDLRAKHALIDGIVRGTIDPNAQAPDPKAQGPIGATALEFPDEIK
jgi:AAA domain (dynein-related subfamily)/CbbQ/NirQ/NorQ C-terminal